MPAETVLVLDGRQRSALAIVRSLGAAGMHVLCAEVAGVASLAAASRFARDSCVYPDPSVDASSFRSAIAALVHQHDVRWLFPASDATTMLLVDDLRFAGRLLAPSADAYRAVSDKARLCERAVALEVPVPDGLCVTGIAAVRDAVHVLGTPCVLKPAVSKYLHAGGVQASSVRVVADSGELERAIAESPWLAQLPTLVQRFVPGHGAGVFVLFDHDHASAWFAHTRLREKPPTGGVSVLSEAAPPDPRLQLYATRLLADVCFRGIAMVEFRIDPAGRPVLMEINARPWGSLQLAIDAGVDFPRLLLGLFEEQPTPASTAGRARLQWLLGDLDNLWLQWRDPHVRVGAWLGAALRVLGSVLDPATRNEVFRWRDARPAGRELGLWLRGR